MYDCVIPAAGESYRMRSPSLDSAGGRVPLKSLLPFGGSTLVETAAQAALDSGARVVLVVGHRGEEVAALFDAPVYAACRAEGRLRVVANPRWEEGMLGSIQAALSELSGSAFFIAHADMPFIAPASYAALARLRESRTGLGLPEAALVASHGGRGGHPVLLPSAWIPAILGLAPGEGLRAFLSGRPREILECGPGALRDIDTPDEYRAALAEFEACQGPGTR